MLVSKTKYEELAEKLAEKEGFLKELSERFEVQKDTILELRQELVEARETTLSEPPAADQAALEQAEAANAALSSELAKLKSERLEWEAELRTLRETSEVLNSRIKEQDARYEASLLHFADLKRTLKQQHQKDLEQLKTADKLRLSGYDRMLRQSVKTLHQIMSASGVSVDQKQYLRARIEELLSFLAEQEDFR